MSVPSEKLPGSPQRLSGVHYLLLALAVLLAVTWIATYSITEREEKNALNATALRAQRLAKFFESHASTTFQYADDYIKAIRRVYRRDISLANVREFMAAVPPSPGILSHITMMDAAGVPILISTGLKERKSKPGVHARDRDYFKFQKANKADTVYISPARKGRNTGLLTVRLVRRITDADGGFTGLVFASVRVPQLLNFFESMRIGPNSSATLIGLDKRIRIRQSQKGFDGIGKTVEGSKLWENFPNNESGSYRQTSIVDGVARLWTYRKVAEFPMIAVIGTAYEDTMDRLTTIRSVRYAVAALISAIGVVLVFFARRAITNTKLQTELEERKRAETELLKAKEDAEKANATKSEFLALASHELRTPLTSIKGSLALMADGAIGSVSENSKDMLTIANRNTDRLIHLVNDILDMERIETGNLEYKFNPLNLANLVTEAVETNMGYAEQYGVAFFLDEMDPNTMVQGDNDRLTQVVANLLSNAAKFSPEKGEITISVTSRDGTARVSIADFGPGIPEDRRDHIFDRFTQVDSSNSRAKGGTGLGLNISRSIIESHGGHIDYESEVGVGSEFFFTLPVAE